MYCCCASSGQTEAEVTSETPKHPHSSIAIGDGLVNDLPELGGPSAIKSREPRYSPRQVSTSRELPVASALASEQLSHRQVPQEAEPNLSTQPAFHVGTFVVELEHPAGMDYNLGFYSDNRGLLITTIGNTGLIARWNLEHPEQRVCPGHRLVEVNGVTGGPSIDCEFRKAGLMRMVFEQGDALVLHFETDYSAIRRVVFPARPLGVKFRDEMPVVVTHCEGVAAELGLKPGWRLVSLDNMALDDMTFASFFEALTSQVAKLPTSCPDAQLYVLRTSTRSGRWMRWPSLRRSPSSSFL